MIFCQADSQSAWGKMYDSQMAVKAKSMGDLIDFSEVTANGKADTQISQIEKAIVARPRILMVSPVSEKVLPTVAKAKAAGIYVFVLDLYKKDFTGSNTYYGPELLQSAEGGPIRYGRQLHLKGTMLVLTGPKDSPFVQLKEKGADLGCKKNNLKEVLSDCGGDREKAKAYVDAYLKAKKPVNVIYALNEAMGLAAVDAVKKAKSKVKILVFGATEKATIANIANGALTAAVTVFPGGLPALEEVPTVLGGGRVPAFSHRANDVIDKTNLAVYLKQTGLTY